MTAWARLRSWLRTLRHGSRLERELDDELRFHLETRADDLRRQGLSHQEALRRARLEFGGLDRAKEACRDERGAALVESVVQDLHYGLRTWRRDPSFTAVIIATLALGIGVNTTIFSWIRAVILDPLPGAGDAGRVVAIESLTPSGEWVQTSYPDYRDFRDHLARLAAVSVTQPMAVAVGDERAAVRVWGEAVSGNVFDLLRVRPVSGRFFSEDERGDAQNAHPVVVVSHRFWTRRFGDHGFVPGMTVRLNRHPFTVIGVAPSDFRGTMAGLSFDFWVPVTMYGQLTSTGNWMLRDRKTRMFRVLARLAPGAAMGDVRAEVRTLAAQLADAHADTNTGMSATVLPLWESHYGLQDWLRAPLGILMGACALVLLTVCANVANLLLARATNRRREFDIRLALGAGRPRLARQLLTEVLLLALVGSALAVGLAAAFGQSLGWMLPTATGPTVRAVTIDGPILFFTAALVVATVVLSGLVPALSAATARVGEALREGGRGSTAGVRAARLRVALVVTEVALAVVTVIGAGLFLKSFWTARDVRSGFDPSGVALARVDLSAGGFDARQADAFCRRLRDELEAQPGVTAVSYADFVPLGLRGDSWEDLQVEGYAPDPGENMKTYRNLVAPGYFALMKIPILEGRDFTLQDDADHAPVMIVTREFVRRFVPTRAALGLKVHGWGRWFTIIGVVDDIKIHRLTEGTMPFFYAPIRQIYRPEMGVAFTVRTSGPIDGALAALVRTARAVDPAVPLFDTIPLEDAIAASLFGERMTASLLGVLATIAFLLAALGLYGLMAYSVAQRTHEIGVRVALGAQRGTVLRMVTAQGLRLAAAGLTAGTLAAVLLGRFVAALLFGVSSTDPGTYAAAAATILAIALAATALPAWRATRVDPTEALRCE